jgi:L-iditol 2-dehydrogenase
MMSQKGKVHLLIEASGQASAFQSIPQLIRKQATVVLYGAGHHGSDLNVLSYLLFLEPTLITSVGASGELDPETRCPITFRDSEKLIRSGTIDARSLITHHYDGWEKVDRAFARDSREQDYVKGVVSLG